MVRQVKINDKVIFGGNKPLVLIAGPCVIESASGALKIAEAIKKITSKLHIPFVFKASFDKVPDNWVCPECGAPKSEFEKI